MWQTRNEEFVLVPRLKRGDVRSRAIRLPLAVWRFSGTPIALAHGDSRCRMAVRTHFSAAGCGGTGESPLLSHDGPDHEATHDAWRRAVRRAVSCA